jgi:hypothetical protein
VQDGVDGLEGVDASAGGGAEDGSCCGAGVCAPFGSAAAGELAVGGDRAEFALAAVVVGGDVGMFEEAEEVLAELPVSLSQSQLVTVEQLPAPNPRRSRSRRPQSRERRNRRMGPFLRCRKMTTGLRLQGARIAAVRREGSPHPDPLPLSWEREPCGGAGDSAAGYAAGPRAARKAPGPITGRPQVPARQT